MGKIYRVLLIEQDDTRIDYRHDTAVPAQRVLFEAASPNAARLLDYVPDEVAAALQEAAGGEVIAAAPVPVASWEAAALAPQAVDEPAPQQDVTEAPSPAKRKRRTRAEIEADKAAALAPQAGADRGPESQEALAAEEPVPATAAPVPAVADSPPAAPPAAGWNPFAPR